MRIPSVSGLPETVRAVAAVALCCLLILAPAASRAEDRTWAEVAELARSGSEEDLAALRSTTSIEGVPANIDLGTGEVTGPRLEALAAVARFGRVDTSSVTESALDILSQPRFAEAPPESFWSRWQRRAVEWMLDAVSWLVAAVGGPLPAAVLALSIVALLGVLLSLSLGRRRAADILRMEAIRRVLEIGEDPADLERRALEAGAAGDHSTAIRLRFVAGLLRLDERGLIDFRAALTTGEVGASLESPIFDELAAVFDRVAYGRHPATADEEAAAVTMWKELLS